MPSPLFQTLFTLVRTQIHITQICKRQFKTPPLSKIKRCQNFVQCTRIFCAAIISKTNYESTSIPINLTGNIQRANRRRTSQPPKPSVLCPRRSQPKAQAIIERDSRIFFCSEVFETRIPTPHLASGAAAHDATANRKAAQRTAGVGIGLTSWPASAAT